uniref:Uncharacterized protein n=1 Tax=Tanacetum cinerariifolium TaxID=118510 RepID=A0A6L2NK14_TANCI|nr:hypothetical protein [Tanacetum cinerariifolium]
MSTPAHPDPKISSQTEALSKLEEFQPLVSRVPLTDEEFEVSEPSDTRITSSHSSTSLDFTAPLSPNHPLTQASPTPTPTRVSFHRRIARMAVRTQPTLFLSMSARIAEATALSPSSFRKRYRSAYETPSPSSSLTLPIRKRYRGTSELILDTETEGESSDSDAEREEDEGPSLKEEEEATPEGQQQAISVVDTAVDTPEGQQQAISVLDMRQQKGAERISAFRHLTPVTWVDPEDGRVYTNIPTYVPPAAHVQTPPYPEWLSGSLPVSSSSLVRLDALPPTLFEDYDRDLRELYTRSWAVRDKIFLQRYRFRSLEQEQERATVTFSAIWRPILALKAWASQTDAQRAALWHAIYDI